MSEAHDQAETLARGIAANADHIARGCRSGLSHNPAVYLHAISDNLAVLVARVQQLEAERDGLLRQRWSHQNRAEVAERGHGASQARDFAQRETIKVLLKELETIEEYARGKASYSETGDWAHIAHACFNARAALAGGAS